MKRAWKYVGIAALVVVLGLGTVAAVAFAQGTTGTTDGPFNYLERFRQNIASLLGISVDQYDSAVVQARDQTLNDAVTEGWLTQNQADQMKQRMENAPADMSAGMPWGGMGLDFGGRGHGGGGWGVDLRAIAAEKLGMTQSDLMTALQGGKTITALAQEKGVDPQTIADAYIAQLTTNLTQAVTNGQITQKQADYMVEQAKTQVTEQLNATWENMGPRGFHGEMVDVLSVAADKLGMTQSDLQTELKSGKTIADIAKEKGVDPQTIIDACIANLTTKLNEAVANGTMTQAQADQQLEQARTQVTNQVNSTWQNFGPGDGWGGHGGGGPMPPAGPDNGTGTDTGTNS
jgi:uncharacterized protein YidB (DUF937 family)